MAVKKRPRAAPAKPADGAGYCVYLGPTIRGVVQNGRVIPGTMEDAKDELADAIAGYPLIASLIVPGTMLSEARVQAKTPGNALYELSVRLLRQLAK